MATLFTTNGEEQDIKYIIPLHSNWQETARTHAEERKRSPGTSFEVLTDPNVGNP